MLTFFLFRSVFKWIFRIILAFVSLSLLWVVAYRFLNPPTTLLIQSRASEYGTAAKQEWVDYDQISDNMKLAVICGEDQRFKDHMGFDFKAIEKAIEHNIEVIKQGVALGSEALSVWLADGSCFPGQLNFRNAFNNTLESLQEIYAALPDHWKVFVEYKAFEPNFYSMSVGDWGQSYLYVSKLGSKASTLVDLGHHLPNANIEQIVALLLMEEKLAGFHFNDSKYGDDDLTAGALKPYQLFLIFNELVEGMDARGMNHAKDLGWMIDASHNVKDPMEDLLQSVEAIMVAYAQALSVDRKALEIAQEENDVVKAQEILQNAFRTDVRALVAEARLRSGAALNPVGLYRDLAVRNGLIAERGLKTVATGL